MKALPWYPRYLSPLPPFLEGCIPPDGLRLHEYVHIDSDISFQASFGLLKPPFTVPHLPTQTKIYFGEMQRSILACCPTMLPSPCVENCKLRGSLSSLEKKLCCKAIPDDTQDTSLLPEAIWISWFQPELTFELEWVRYVFLFSDIVALDPSGSSGQCALANPLRTS